MYDDRVSHSVKIVLRLGLALFLTACAAPAQPPSFVPVTVTPLPLISPTPPPTWTAAPPLAPGEPTHTPGAPMGFDTVISLYHSPDGLWESYFDYSGGSLELAAQSGERWVIYPAGSGVTGTYWMADSQSLLFTRQPSVRLADGSVSRTAPVRLEEIRIEQNAPAAPRLLFESTTPPYEPGKYEPEQLRAGTSSPNGRFLTFWWGVVSSSIQADGLPFYLLDTDSGTVTPLAPSLVNLQYQSWSPDSSAFVHTAGTYRSAQIQKRLEKVDVKTGSTRTVVPETDAVPGIVAWSPRGDLIAYAAVVADQTGQEWADWMTLENPAIRARRIYLLDPATGVSRRLNDASAFQDAPVWSDDGAVLYYVQNDGDAMVLMAADPSTGDAAPVPNVRIPIPEPFGYYGQTDWRELLERIP